MKLKFICVKLSKSVILLFCIILIQFICVLIGLNKLKEEKNFEQIKQNVNSITNTNIIQKQNNTINKTKNAITKSEIDNTIIKNENIIAKNKIEEYTNMPKELKGYKVVGRLEIPKIKLNTYILAEANTKELKVSVSKLYGPDINKVGNFCIAGHNYRNMKMFGGIKKLELEDSIIVTDTYNRSVAYTVYQNYKTDPKDISCLNQETNGERELTLITCTAGALQRVVVKAVEVYD